MLKDRCYYCLNYCCDVTLLFKVLILFKYYCFTCALMKDNYIYIYIYIYKAWFVSCRRVCYGNDHLFTLCFNNGLILIHSAPTQAFISKNPYFLIISL